MPQNVVSSNGNLSCTMNSDGVMHIIAKAATYSNITICNIITRSIDVSDYFKPNHRYLFLFNILDAKKASANNKINMSIYQYNSTDSNYKSYTNYSSNIMVVNTIDDLNSIIFRIDVWKNVVIDEDIEFDARPIIYDITDQLSFSNIRKFDMYAELPSYCYDADVSDDYGIIVDLDLILNSGVYLLTNPGHHYINGPDNFAASDAALWLFVYNTGNYVVQRIRQYGYPKYSEREIRNINRTSAATTKTNWSTVIDYNNIALKSDFELFKEDIASLDINDKFSEVFTDDIYWFKIIKPLYNISEEGIESIDGEYIANGDGAINPTIANSNKWKSMYVTLDNVSRVLINESLRTSKLSYKTVDNNYNKVKSFSTNNPPSEIIITDDEKYFTMFFEVANSMTFTYAIIITNMPSNINFDFSYIFDNIDKYEYFKKYIVKTNKYEIYDEFKTIPDYKDYRRYKAYDVVTCESINDGYYKVSWEDATNYINPHIEFIEDENIRTYLCPIIKENRYIQLYYPNANMNKSMVLFDSDKNPVSFISVYLSTQTNLYYAVLPNKLDNIKYFGYIEDSSIMNYDALISNHSRN